jgi:type IV pilus assembly protein PilQ
MVTDVGKKLMKKFLFILIIISHSVFADDYENQLVSFNFQKIDVRAVLNILFDLPGVNVNMVAGEDVHGTVTLRLNNVPWKQALKIILETKNLTMQREGNIVKINVIKKPRIKIIKLHHAKAQDIIAILANKNVNVDDRSNSLIIQDTEAKIEELAKVIKLLDIPARQLLIESKIVLTTSEFSQELAAKFSDKHDENQYLLDDNFIVTLPNKRKKTSIIGVVIDNKKNELLELELLSMQSQKRGELISIPKIISKNRQQAHFAQQLKTNKMTLRVTPEITPDQRISLALSLNFNKNELKTNTVINNGETLVLGSVYHKKGRFSKLPLIGKLFKQRQQELLIFVRVQKIN